MRTQWGSACIALVWFLCALQTAAAQQDGIAITRATSSHANHIPGDVTLYLSIKDAAKLKNRPAGEFVESALTAFVPEGEVRSAWRELSRTVGLPPDQSFDMLLGRRVTLVARKADNAPASWAILTEIDQHTYRLLQAKLKGAPRDIIKGRPVLALERGKFLLTTESSKRKGPALALLGPRADADLFKQIAASLGGFHKSPLSAIPQFAQARELNRDASLLFFTRNTDNPVDPLTRGQYTNGDAPRNNKQEPVGGWLALTATTSGSSITIKGLSSSAQDRTHATTWSQRAFQQMSEGALVAIMDDALLASIPFDPAGFFDLPHFEDLADADLLTEAWAFRMEETEQGLAFAEAARTTNINRLAPRADRIISESLAQQLADPSIADNDFSDFDPSITRSINLASLIDRPAQSLLGPMPAIAWRFDRAESPLHSEPESGWWVLATSTNAVDVLSAHISAATADHPEPWVALGVARPAKLISRLMQDTTLPAFIPFLDPFTRLDTVEWRAAEADQDLLYLQVDIELAKPGLPRVKRIK